MCSTATSSIRRAGASTSSRTCSSTDRPATAEVVKHIDRCLSCLACMTTCPSGVHYMHLVDHARAHIEETYRRPLGERLLRAMLANADALSAALPAGASCGTARQAIRAGRRGAWAQAACRDAPAVAVAAPHRPLAPQTFPPAGRAEAASRSLPAASTTCSAPEINAAAIGVLTRHGIEVVLPDGAGCCGSLVHHMGREDEALAQARANIDAWSAIEGLDAIVIYGFGLRHDGQGLWLHAARRPGLCRPRGPRRRI